MEFEYDFTRYLAAKKTVDDRALNKNVWQQLRQEIPDQPDILEIGAGIGTMVERLAADGMVQNGHFGKLSAGCYTAIDNQPANITAARSRLSQLPPALSLTLEVIDLFDFAAREQGKRLWDLLIAHAFLDLMDIPATLPILFSLLKPGGLCYFTINFDGATSLEPAIDPAFDGLVEQLYHHTMDERIVNGRYSGDSRSGRHLFSHLRQNGIEIIAAGSSDWVVFAGKDGYPADEAYFLHFIVHTIHQALRGHAQLVEIQFEEWIAQRHAQIEAGELVYIAHQLDFLGRK
ncbi:MAG: methyltransferase [Aquificales bacterium]|nr:methyltransferase [Aquificales bacterium]